MTADKPRVLVINQYAFPREYGGITRTFDQFSRLKDWTVRIISTSRNHYTGDVMTSSDDRFTLVPLPHYEGNGRRRMVGWGLFAAQAVAAGLRGARPEVVVGSSPQMLAPVAAWLVSRARRARFVIEVRDLWPESLVTAGALERHSRLHRTLVRLETFLYHQAAAIIAVTPGWEDHVAELGVDPGKLVVIGNGADLADFETTETREQTRERLARNGFTFDGFTAVFSGNHSTYVGLDLIVVAAAELSDVNFVLIGSGSRKQWAVDEVARLGLTNVRFLDQMGKPDLVSFLRASDVGLHTVNEQSVFDKGMSPNKLFDYLAAGLPVVSNAAVPLREVIQDGDVGAVVAPNDLVSGIIRVREADEATKLGWRERARELMAERFSLDSSARRLEALLDQVTARGQRPGEPAVPSGEPSRIQ